MSCSTGLSKFFGLTTSVAPSARAISSFAGFLSTAMMRSAFAMTAP
jgi:hypothetical protein